MEEVSSATQLIDGSGQFNVSGLEKFVKETKLADCGLSYAVVAIMGPQSSGKSTLLNHLFYTSFKEMDAFQGRSQTTKGIWIAKCIGLKPFTIVLDLEGTDGRERGEDDTAFEKQSALFSLAVADIVLINMWCHDIGREQAANRPLLKTVFQVMTRLFSPRKTTLLFVIRDKSKTPLELLEPVLREDIQKIWDAVCKPDVHLNTPLSDFFNVEVTALSSYEDKEQEFKEQVMVATVRCEEIAYEKFCCLTSDNDWLALEEAVQAGPVSGFGEKLSAILQTYISEYDTEAEYFDEGVKQAKREQFISKALDFVHPAYVTMLGHIRLGALENFKTSLEKSLNKGEGFAASVRACSESCMVEFQQGCADASIRQADWDVMKIQEKLSRDIDSHVSSVRSRKLSEMKACYEKQLKESLSEPVEALLEAGGKDTWASIRQLLKHETQSVVSDLLTAISGFELDQATVNTMVQSIRNYARNVVEKKAREEAGNVLIHMKDKFSTVFSHDQDSMPRVWAGKEDIKAITKDARCAALRILSIMAVIRLDESSDKIENILVSSLVDGTTPLSSSHATADPLASSTWEEISPKNTLITPVQCKSLWRQFKAETEYIVTQAITAQETHKRNNNWLPPPWAIMAIIFLGFNEFMLLLKNPLYLIALFVVYLLSKALWVQLDITREFQHGTLAGLLSISSRFLPTIMNLLQGRPTHESALQQQPLSSHSFNNQTQPNPVSSSTSDPSNISSYESSDAEYSGPNLIQRQHAKVQDRLHSERPSK